MERNQFTFYNSFYRSIENLRSNKEKLQAYQMICNYALTGKEPDPDAIKPGVATIFAVVRPILDTAMKRSKASRESTPLVSTHIRSLP